VVEKLCDLIGIDPEKQVLVFHRIPFRSAFLIEDQRVDAVVQRLEVEVIDDSNNAMILPMVADNLPHCVPIGDDTREGLVYQNVAVNV